jgi:hypothetical protein
MYEVGETARANGIRSRDHLLWKHQRADWDGREPVRLPKKDVDHERRAYE